MCSLRSPVSHKTERLLINRQRFLQAARAVCNMMNFLCTGVTTNVSDNEKHPRIKDYKLLNFLKLPLLFLTYFFSLPAPVPAFPPRSPLPELIQKTPAASPQPPPQPGVVWHLIAFGASSREMLCAPSSVPGEG